MKKTKFSKLFDFLFGSIFVFLICFVWSRYFIHNIWITVLISATITFCSVALFHIVKSNKEVHQNFNQLELEKAHNFSLNFLLSTKQEVIKTFSKYVGEKYTVKLKSDYLIVNNNILRPIYTTQTISDKDVLESYAKVKNTNCKKIILTCQNASENARLVVSMIKDKKIVILTEYDAYMDIFKPLSFPIPTLEKEIK